MKARWMAEQAMTKVAKFRADGTLLDVQLLAKAYIMGAVMYDNIANMFDDAVISDRTVAGPNLGEANMIQMYDSALKWLDAGAAIATGENRMNTLGDARAGQVRPRRVAEVEPSREQLLRIHS